MGGRLSHQPRYGVSNLSNDSNGNVIVGGGANLLFEEDGYVAKAGSPTYGLHLETNRTNLRASGANIASVVNGALWTIATLLVRDQLQLLTSATQSITGTGSTLSIADASHIKVTSDGVYTLTTALTATSDGMVIVIENIGANDFTLQEGVLVAVGACVVMRYSSDAAAWIQEG